MASNQKKRCFFILWREDDTRKRKVCQSRIQFPTAWSLEYTVILMYTIAQLHQKGHKPYAPPTFDLGKCCHSCCARMCCHTRPCTWLVARPLWHCIPSTVECPYLYSRAIRCLPPTQNINSNRYHSLSSRGTVGISFS